MKHILSTEQFKKKELEIILDKSWKMEQACKKGKILSFLKNKIIACIFFEPSTRTRLSFETAALKLGAKVISVENAENNSSAYKGETIEDTTRMVCCYADILIMRHPEVGAALRASEVAIKPIINAGDGSNQHPTQALLDLYTIKKEHGRLNNLNIAFVGDLLYGRTLHSLVPLLAMYRGNTFYFISPKELKLSEEYKKNLKDKNITFKEIDSIKNVLPIVDILYMTRVQKERFKNIEDYKKVKDLFLLKVEDIKYLKKNAIIMHPLPRVNEIDPKIDKDSRAAYFRQAKNGLYVRMALLHYVLGF